MDWYLIWRSAVHGAALVVGVFATLAFYVVLLAVQTINADHACESYPQSVPGAGFQDVRSFGFENSWVNLGGYCTYGMTDGTTVTAYEPGLWFSGTIFGAVVALGVLTVYLARRKGHPGLLFGVCSLIAPPAAFLVAMAVPRKA